MTNNKTNTDLISALGLDKMTDEHRAMIMSELGEIVLDSAILRLLSTLDDKQREEIKKDLDAGLADSEGVASYLIKKFPSFATILEEEMNAFRKEIKTVTGVSE